MKANLCYRTLHQKTDLQCQIVRYLRKHKACSSWWLKEPVCSPYSLHTLRLLLGDAAVELRLVLGQRRVGLLGEKHRSVLQRPFEQEPPRCHQVAVALTVREGISWAPRADSTAWRKARHGGRECLFSDLVPHLQKDNRYSCVKCIIQATRHNYFTTEIT